MRLEFCHFCREQKPVTFCMAIQFPCYRVSIVSCTECLRSSDLAEKETGSRLRDWRRKESAAPEEGSEE